MNYLEIKIETKKIYGVKQHNPTQAGTQYEYWYKYKQPSGCTNDSSQNIRDYRYYMKETYNKTYKSKDDIIGLISKKINMPLKDIKEQFSNQIDKIYTDNNINYISGLISKKLFNDIYRNDFKNSINIPLSIELSKLVKNIDIFVIKYKHLNRVKTIKINNKIC